MYLNELPYKQNVYGTVQVCMSIARLPVVMLEFVGGPSPWQRWPAAGAPSHTGLRNISQLSP
jgi:hypothetical protein